MAEVVVAASDAETCESFTGFSAGATRHDAGMSRIPLRTCLQNHS